MSKPKNLEVTLQQCRGDQTRLIKRFMKKFKKSGIMVGNNYYTYDTVPKYDGPVTNLSDILFTPGKVPIEYVVEPNSVMKEKGWKYLK